MRYLLFAVALTLTVPLTFVAIGAAGPPVKPVPDRAGAYACPDCAATGRDVVGTNDCETCGGRGWRLADAGGSVPRVAPLPVRWSLFKLKDADKPDKKVTVELWQGVGASKQMIGTVEIADGVIVQTADGKVYGPSPKGPHRYDQIDIVTVTPRAKEDGPKVGEWFGK